MVKFVSMRATGLAVVLMLAGGAAFAQPLTTDSHKPKPFDVPRPVDIPVDPNAPPSPEAVAVMNQELAKPRTEPGYTTPRLSNGQPDITGVWSTASNTSLARPGQFKTLVMNDEEVARARAVHPQNVRQATDDNQKTSDGLLDGKDLDAGRGYNSFWIDPGTNYGLVKGTWRTSWIVEPANGQIPFTEAGRKFVASIRSFGTRGSGYDHPEERGYGERCISMMGGPPLMNSLYNNNFQIVQSPTDVIIVAEMVHDARIIKLQPQHDTATLNKYMGDSIGWWEGDTLVVETVNINPNTGSMVRLSDEGKVIERFTRYNDKQILYEFEIHDPKYYKQVWKGEMSLNRSPGIYEYACHEGNYGLVNILLGGRIADSEGRDPSEAGDREEE
jgi:hypothetical protein